MIEASLLTDISAQLLDHLGRAPLKFVKSVTANTSLIQNHFHGSKIFRNFQTVPKNFRISNHVIFATNLECICQRSNDFQRKRGQKV